MKRITKLLSFAMVLIMLCGLTSSMGEVFAATAPSLNKKSRTVYVGSSKVTKTPETYKFYIKNKPSKYSAAWTSSNPAVATVSKLKGGKGRVTGKSVGTAIITCKVTDKKTKAVTTLTAKVTVKKNASKVKVNSVNMKKDALSVGDTVKFSSYMYDNMGKEGLRGKYVTDYRRWISSDPKVATISSTGELKAVGAGEVTITVYSYQHKKYKALKYATATDTYKIKVVGGLQAAEQMSLNQMKLTFYSNLSTELTLEKANEKLNIVRSISGSAQGVEQKIQNIKFDSTGKIATVTMYGEFAIGSSYTVKYGDDVKNFTAKAGKAVKLVPYTADGMNVALVRKTTPILFRVYDADGIDVTPLTESGYKALNDKIDIKTESKDCLLDGKGIYFTEANKKAAVIATYHTGIYQPSSPDEVDTFVGVVEITSVDESTAFAADSWTLMASNKRGSGYDWTKPVHALAAGDNGFKMVVKAKGADGNAVYSDDASNNFSFESQNEAVLLVDGSTGILLAIAKGKADVIVKYNNAVLTAYTIEVSEARVPQKIVFNQSSFYVSDFPDYCVQKVTMTVKDQLGETIKMQNDGSTVKDVSITCNTTPAPPASAVANSDGTVTITVDAMGYGSTSGKAYNYRVNYGKLYENFTIIAKTPTGTSTYRVEADVTGLDMKLVDGAASFPTVTFGLYEYKNSVKYSKISNIRPESNGSFISGDYYYSLTKDNVKVDAGTKEGAFVTATVSNNVVTKALTGSYLITVYRKTATASERIGTASFVLSDSQEVPVITNISSSTSAAISSDMASASVASIITDCFQIKLRDKAVDSTDIEPVVKIVGTSAIYVESIKIRQMYNIDGSTVFYYHTVKLGKTITKK